VFTASVIRSYVSRSSHHHAVSVNIRVPARRKPLPEKPIAAKLNRSFSIILPRRFLAPPCVVFLIAPRLLLFPFSFHFFFARTFVIAFRLCLAAELPPPPPPSRPASGRAVNQP